MRVTPSGAALGATVTGVDLSQALSPQTVADIRAAWLRHGVLAFPDQNLSDDDLERFSLYFGRFGQDPFIAPIPGRTHILEVRREAAETTPIFAEVWHSDWSFLPTPPAATILYGIEIPPVGGDTLFSSTTAAYQALTPDMKTRLAGLHGVHSAARGYSKEGLYGENDKGRSMSIRPSDEAKKRQSHRVVKHHPETDEPALFVNMGYTVAIEDLDEAEGWPLLIELFTHQMKDEFVFAQRWTPGQLVMWDNRCVNHKATGGYEGYRRVLHRTTVAG
jgi:taurine dioxygenase